MQKIDVPTFYEKKWFLDSLSASQSAKPTVLSVISGCCDDSPACMELTNTVTVSKVNMNDS